MNKNINSQKQILSNTLNEIDVNNIFGQRLAENLKLVAYENYHKTVFHTWLILDDDSRHAALKDRYIFFSICFYMENYLHDLLKVEFNKASAFVSSLLKQIIKLEEELPSFSEEWFRALDKLADVLIENGFLPEARESVNIAFRTGVNKFPSITQSISVHSAYLDAMVGNKSSASNIALYLVRRPYLLPNKKELPKLYHKLMHILATGNHLQEYREVLWKGVSSLRATSGLRDSFVEQIVKTYRGVIRALIRREVPLRYRIPFFVGNLARLIAKVEVLRVLRIDKPFRWSHLLCLYIFESHIFQRTRTPANIKNVLSVSTINKTHKSKSFYKLRRRKRRILITRAMGGIGDILMMTPGLRALTLIYPDAQIDFAIPKSFHPILLGLEGINVLDINDEPVDIGSYSKWVNLTDCPAGKVESKQYPNVRSNRIEIFAKAMGVSRYKLRKYTKGLPLFQVMPEEQSWATDFISHINQNQLPLLGIQPFSADSYKNWPYMEDFVKEASHTHYILIFHHEEINGFEYSNVHKVKQPLRKSVALAKQCKSMVVVDSSFHHFAGALGIPTVSIFGATSGKVFSRYYPNVQLATPKKSDYPCYPCWRNEHKPCHLTNGRESICFRSISIESVKSKLQSAESQVLPNLLQRVIKWIKYGVE